MKFKVLFSSFVLLLLTYGSYVLVFEVEYNRCVMTYMYELPRYQKMQMNPQIEKLYPKYTLYFYGEGVYHTKYKNAKKLNGVPVLFIPGNAGSYRQVRSMASVALRMAESMNKTNHFNYFTIDFNGELVAFHGDYIQAQTQFAVHCIQHILSKYTTASSVVVIAHSMGGIVARNLYSYRVFQPQWVHTIITQSTPHRLPVLSTDAAMRSIYEQLDNDWHHYPNAGLENVTLVSLTGGTRDLQVRDGLGDVTNFAAIRDRSLWRSTSSVLRAWASTDHLCAVWCKQIVMNLNRALFEMIDPKTKQLTANPKRKMDIFKRHLIAGHTHDTKIGKKLWPLNASQRWLYKANVERFSFQREELRTVIFIKFGPFSYKKAFRAIFILNEAQSSWLFLCQTAKPKDPCTAGYDVTSWAIEAPPFEINRRIVHLERKMFSNFDGDVYLVARLQPTKKELEVFYERYNVRQRQIKHSPGLKDFILGLPIVRDQHDKALVPETEAGAIYYRVNLPDLYHVRQGLEIRARVLSCEATAGSVGLMSLHSPWDNFYVHSSLWYWNNGSLSLSLATSRPADSEHQAVVELMLDPTCRYRLYLHHSVDAMTSQFLRVYAPYLPSYVLIHILSGLSMQLMQATRGEEMESIMKVKNRIPLILPALIFGFVLNSAPMAKLPLPKNDVAILQTEGLWFPLVMQCLFIVAMAFFVLLFGVCGFLASLLAIPLCRQGRRFPCRIAFLINCVVFELGALYTSLWVCGGLTTVILLVSQLFMTVIEKASKSRTEAFNFRMSILILLSLMAIVDAPNFAVWLKTLHDNDFKRLPPPTAVGIVPFMVSFAVMVLAPVDPSMWRSQPVVVRTGSYAIMVAAVAAPLYCTFALHLLRWNIAFCLITIAVMSLVLQALATPPKHEKTA